MLVSKIKEKIRKKESEKGDAEEEEEEEEDHNLRKKSSVREVTATFSTYTKTPFMFTS